MSPFDGLSIIDRMVKAVEMVRERLLRSTAALEQAGVPYCVFGGNAVAACVQEQIDHPEENLFA